MLFNSLTFVVFFLATLALYNLARRWSTQKTILLAASYLFYAAWNPPFVILLWLSTLIDWYAAKKLVGEERRGRRNLYLFISLAANLGLLGYFKYGEFLMQNFAWMLNQMGVAYQPPVSNIVLPVGISFYTFQTMSYTLDVYLRRAAPAKSFLDFALYVTFFPQLVAGPIVRATDFLPQCETPRRTNRTLLSWGLFLMVLGLFEKVVLADSFLSRSAEVVFGSATAVHPLDAWLGVLAFAGQIFCDFAGYSTCAIGASLCFGFHLPDNFRFPYAAIGFSDFWRRWHISLSTWLRDYLYIPLGGNRQGSVRTGINLMTTMLLGGLWHGASWTFVVWGGLHGLFLLVERQLKQWFGHASWVRHVLVQAGLGLLTYFLVLITWVFFRATDFSAAWRLIESLFGRHAQDGALVLSTLDMWKVSVVTVGLNATHWLMRHTTIEAVMAKMPRALVVVLWASMAIAVILAQGAGNAFIYFQF